MHSWTLLLFMWSYWWHEVLDLFTDSYAIILDRQTMQLTMCQAIDSDDKVQSSGPLCIYWINFKKRRKGKKWIILFLTKKQSISCSWHGLMPFIICISLNSETFLYIFIFQKTITIFPLLRYRFCWSLNIQKGVNIALVLEISTFKSSPTPINFCILLLVVLKFWRVAQCVLSTGEFCLA